VSHLGVLSRDVAEHSCA
ncbi:hypothetical protein A2U01_0016677, partial [Trifolium medium]|nr:hypothetical protein [Trifolium medium]